MSVPRRRLGSNQPHRNSRHHRHSGIAELDYGQLQYRRRTRRRHRRLQLPDGPMAPWCRGRSGLVQYPRHLQRHCAHPTRCGAVLIELAVAVARDDARAGRLCVGPCAVLRHRRRGDGRTERHRECFSRRQRRRRPVTAADTQTRFGWTAGGGIEYAFTSYLSGKVEYLYVGLGSQNQIVVDNVKFSTNIVRGGLNLHF
jgi:opacity protein-like surface antigen